MTTDGAPHQVGQLARGKVLSVLCAAEVTLP